MLIFLIACDSIPPQPPPQEPPPPPAPVEPLPPDPCRHSVLELLSPSELDAFVGETDCMARVEMWKTSTRMWAASADLDGDEDSETIVLLAHTDALTQSGIPCPADGCPATLIAGDASVSLLFHWAEGEHFAEREVRLVDIDTTDNRQEVLVRHRQADVEDPAYTNHLLIFDGALTDNRLEASQANQGVLTLAGDGRVGMEDSDCAHRTIRWFRLTDGVLVVEGEDVTLQPDAEQFQLPDGSYSCPG